MNVIPNEFQEQFAEIKLRGIYLQLAVDAEFIMSMIIAECFKYNKAEITSFHFDKDGKGRDLDDLTMAEKVDVCKKGLNKYYPEFYNQHLTDLEEFDKLRWYRNRFAHYKMDFDATDKSKIWLRKLASNYRVQSEQFELKQLWIDLEEYRKRIMSILVVIQTFIAVQPSAVEPAQP